MTIRWKSPPPLGIDENLRQWLLLQEQVERDTAPLLMPWILFADLPPAVEHEGNFFYISDTGQVAYSDGSSWIFSGVADPIAGNDWEVQYNLGAAHAASSKFKFIEPFSVLQLTDAIWQIAHTLPKGRFNKTNEAPDNRLWEFRVTAFGKMELRATNDAGDDLIGDSVFSASRSGVAVTFVDFGANQNRFVSGSAASPSVLIGSSGHGLFNSTLAGGTVRYAKSGGVDRGELATLDHTQSVAGMTTPLRQRRYANAAALPAAGSWQGATAFLDDIGSPVWSDGTKWKSAVLNLTARSVVALDTEFSIVGAATWDHVDTGWTVIEDPQGLWNAANGTFDLSAVPDAIACEVRLQGDMENTANQPDGAGIGLGWDTGAGLQDPTNGSIQVIAGGQIARRQDFPFTILQAASPLIAVTDPANTEFGFYGWGASLDAIDILGSATNSATWMEIRVYE